MNCSVGLREANIMPVTMRRKETMSRIHEALKKAEQERAAAQPVDNPTSLPSDGDRGYPAWRMKYPMMRQVSSSIQPPVVPQSGNLRRFEDLCQQCAHPHWHPDPNVNIFSNPALSANAAEQFSHYAIPDFTNCAAANSFALS